MDLFNLPSSTKVNRIIAKDNFNTYTNTKQRQEFTDKIERMRWLNKLSTDTINLGYQEIQEIHVFQIELKQKENISKILEIIERAIPYHIVFQVEYGDYAYLSTSKKHPNATDEHNAVIDWTFQSDWFLKNKNPFKFFLTKSLDAIYQSICLQISGNQFLEKKTIEEVLEYHKGIYSIENEIKKLKNQLKREGQFNRKLELNLKIQENAKLLNDFKNNEKWK